jgi:two-component system, LytTR family, sensor kinase
MAGMFTPQNLFFEIFMLLSSVTPPFMIKLSRVITDYSLRVARLTKEKTDLEIDFLRTQLNPHFLLNSLNNIYSQVVTKDEKAADSIISLSDSMKYILYKSSEAMVDLDSEIQFLKNYVDLQKLKGISSMKIRFSQGGEMTEHVIAPLILINFIENAFKHGGGHEAKELSIDIDIKFIKETLFVRIENDFVEKADVSKKVDGGIGIANTSKRIALLYPNQHNLTIKKENGKFLVELSIKLKRK